MKSGAGKTVGSVLNEMENFLNKFQKTAEEGGVVATTPEVESLEKTNPVGTEQTNIGKEQQAESENAGSTAASSAPENTDANATLPVDEKDPKTMDADDKAKSSSVIAGETRTLTIGQQETSQEEKAASLQKLGTQILQHLDAIVTQAAKPKPVQKTASERSVPAKAQPKPQAPAAPVIDPILEKIAAASIIAGQTHAVAHFMGQLSRIEKEQALRAGGLEGRVIQKYGSVQAMFEKIAAENEELLLPPELGGAAEGAVADAGQDLGAGGAMPPELGEAAPAADAGAAPGGLAAAGEAPVSPEVTGNVDELTQALAENVTPEDVAQAEQAIQELQAAGATPEEIGEAVLGLVQEAIQEGGAGGGAEVGMAEAAPAEAAPEAPPAEETPAETPAEESPAEEPPAEEPPAEEEEKSAAMQKLSAERVAVCKEYLRKALGK